METITAHSGRLRAASHTVRDMAQLAIGMSIVAGVFLFAQSLLFVEELWWP